MEPIDDDIDSELLQAKIDLSISVANDLVSSWVKPTRKSGSTSRKNAEQELKEHMRRPPRLGVGAPIPEGAMFSVETARLKTQLTGKANHKRPREEEDDTFKVPSDNEEESRGTAIKKKSTVDPFERAKKNPKRHKTLTEATPQPESSTQISVGDQELPPDVEMNFDAPPGASVDSALTSPSSKKKKKRKKPTTDTGATHPLNSPTLGVRTPLSFIASPKRLTYPKVSPMLRAANLEEAVEAAPVSPRSRTRTVIPGSVLNLDGPPLSPADGGNANEEVSTGNKKKRKRRKKKKTPGEHDGVGDIDASNEI